MEKIGECVRRGRMVEETNREKEKRKKDKNAKNNLMKGDKSPLILD